MKVRINSTWARIILPNRKKNKPPRYARTAHYNIITHLPGIKTIIECWSLFIPDNDIQEIVTCTIIYLSKIRINYEKERDVLNTSVDEMRALAMCNGNNKD